MKESKAKILSCPVLSDIPESTRLSEVYRTLPICPSDKSTLKVIIKHLWKNTDGRKTEVLGEKKSLPLPLFPTQNLQTLAWDRNRTCELRNLRKISCSITRLRSE